MPATHAQLIANTGDFVRDYTVKWSADMNNMNVLLKRADCNTLNGARYVGVADIVHGYTNNNKCRVTPKNVKGRLWSWFNVEKGGVSSWGETQNIVLNCKIKLYENNPHTPGAPGYRNRRAYCLPYANNRIASITLGNDANFFFTDALSGCTVFIRRIPGRPVTVYHANAMGLNTGDKNSYMERLFQQVSGVAASHQTVRYFASLRYMLRTFSTPDHLRQKVQRKRRQLRKNIEWKVIGASVIGLRTGNNQWDFYWQVLGFMEYDRPDIEVWIDKHVGFPHRKKVVKHKKFWKPVNPFLTAKQRKKHVMPAKKAKEKHVVKKTSLSVLRFGQL